MIVHCAVWPTVLPLDAWRMAIIIIIYKRRRRWIDIVVRVAGRQKQRWLTLVWLCSNTLTLGSISIGLCQFYQHPASMDCLDVKPDLKLLGQFTPATSNQYSDVKPSDCADLSNVNVDPGMKRLKPDSCVMCRYVSPYDIRLHQIPLVVMKQFDVSKLIPGISTASW